MIDVSWPVGGLGSRPGSPPCPRSRPSPHRAARCTREGTLAPGRHGARSRAPRSGGLGNDPWSSFPVSVRVFATWGGTRSTSHVPRDLDTGGFDERPSGADVDGRGAARRPRLQAGAQPRLERVLQLRDLARRSSASSAGCFTTYGQAWNDGGPIAISIGWPVISILVLLVGLSMAELASKYPTAGGIYYWAYSLGGVRWAWFTGWFNLLGLVAIVAAVDYGCASFLNSVLAPLQRATSSSTSRRRTPRRSCTTRSSCSSSSSPPTA